RQGCHQHRRRAGGSLHRPAGGARRDGAPGDHRAHRDQVGRAQLTAMPKAYLICYVDITNPTAYDEYRKLPTAAAEKYGATYLARGGKTDVLEGEPSPERVVIIASA